MSALGSRRSRARDDRATVVSITPAAVGRDSRTYKQATSLARFGYRSIVVEGRASDLPAAPPFELITVPRPSQQLPAASATGAAPAAGDGALAAPVPERKQAPGGKRFGSARERFWRGLWTLRTVGYERRYALRQRASFNRRTYRAMPHADLYVVHAYFQLPAVFLARTRRRVPFAYDAHDSYFEMGPDSDDLWMPAMARIESTAVARAAGFSTVSDGLADILEERHGRRPRVIRNLPDLRLEEPVDRGVREAVGVADWDFLLVAVGQDKAGMTVAEAIEAIAALPERFHLAVLGAGQRRHASRARELGVADRVHLLEPVPPTRVASFISSADAAAVLYHPLTRNYVNALPNGFFQPIAAGLPVLVPRDLVEVEKIAREHRLGITIDARDPASIAAALSELGADPEVRRTLAAASLAAREELSWEREEGLLREHVEAILAGR